MWLYSKQLGKDVYCAKVEGDTETLGGGAACCVLIWTEKTGWKWCGISHFEAPREHEQN